MPPLEVDQLYTKRADGTIGAIISTCAPQRLVWTSSGASNNWKQAALGQLANHGSQSDQQLCRFQGAAQRTEQGVAFQLCTPVGLPGGLPIPVCQADGADRLHFAEHATPAESAAHPTGIDSACEMCPHAHKALQMLTHICMSLFQVDQCHLPLRA